MALAVMGWSPVTMMTKRIKKNKRKSSNDGLNAERNKRGKFRFTFNSGGTALGNGVGHGSAGRINHGNESDEAESSQREVGIVSVESVSLGELVQGQESVAKAQDSLAETAQLHVGRVESVPHLVVQRLLNAVEQDGRANVQDALGRSLHGQKVAAVVLVLIVVQRHLVLVGRVERHFAHLLVAGADGHGLTGGQLDALEQSGFRGVAVDFALQNGNVVLAGLEFSAAAQSSNAGESLPAAARLVVLGTYNRTN